MPGNNHYFDCTCGWCLKFGGRYVVNWALVDARRTLKERHYREGSFASCFVNPNASCPVCHQQVFFYANAYGSRVYFDDLGKPWPKHGCTDQGRRYAIRTPGEKALYVPLARRKRGEIEEIFDAFVALGEDPRSERLGRYNAIPQSVFIAVRTARRGFMNYVKGEELVGGDGSVAYFKFNSQTFEVTVGDIFSMDDSSEPSTISFPNMQEDDRTVRRFKVWQIAEQEFENACNYSG